MSKIRQLREIKQEKTPATVKKTTVVDQLTKARPASKNTRLEVETESVFTQHDNLNIPWTVTGVTPVYRRSFEKVLSELPDELRNTYVEREKRRLRLLESSLKQFKIENERREQIVVELKENIYLVQKNGMREFLLSKLVTLMDNYRDAAVLCVEKIVQLDETINVSFSGKLSAQQLNKNFGYSKSFLLKINDELTFLHKSPIAKYFNFTKYSDPFLLAAAEDVNCEGLFYGETKKIVLPLKTDLHGRIKECQLHIIDSIVKEDLEKSKIKCLNTGQRLPSATRIGSYDVTRQNT